MTTIKSICVQLYMYIIERRALAQMFMRMGVLCFEPRLNSGKKLLYGRTWTVMGTEAVEYFDIISRIYLVIRTRDSRRYWVALGDACS